MSVLRWLNENLERVLCIFATIIVIGAMGYQVLARFVLNIPAPMTDEIAIYAVIWLTYFGASLAAIQRRHIRITILHEFLPKKGRIIVDILSNFVCCAFMAFLAYGAWFMVEDAFKNNYTAGTMPFLPTWVILMALPVAFTLTCFRLMQDNARLVREFNQPVSSTEAK